MKRPWYIWFSVPAFIVLAFVTNIRTLCKKPFRLTRWLRILGKVLFLFVVVLMLPMLALNLTMTLLASVNTVFLWIGGVVQIAYFYGIGVYMNASLVRWAQLNLSGPTADEPLDPQTRAREKRLGIAVGCIIVAIVLLLIVCIFSLRKSSISVEEFYAAMEQENLTVVDAAEQLEDVEGWVASVIESVTIARNENVQIEFQQMTSDQDAQLYFLDLRNKVEESYGNSGSTSVSTNILTTHIYSLTTQLQYFYLAAVDDTFLFAVTDIENQTELKQIIQRLGY